MTAGTEWWPDPQDKVQWQYWASVFLPGTASIDPQFAWYQESGTLWSLANFSTFEQVVACVPSGLSLKEHPFERVTYRNPVNMEGMLSRVVSQITLNAAYIFNDAALQSQTYGTGVASQPVHNGFSYETRMAASKRPDRHKATVAHHLAQVCVQGSEGVTTS